MTWRESQHPRDYRGRFTEAGSGQWEQQTLMQLGMGRSTGDQILDAVKNGRVVYQEKASGGTTAETEFVIYEMDDGSRVHTVRKRASADHQQMEVWAGQIGQAIEAPVPVVVEDPDDDSVVHMEWIDAEPLGSQIGEDDGGEAISELYQALIEQNPRDALMLGLLDLLTGNRDRHVNNVLANNRGIYGIDHDGNWTDVHRRAFGFPTFADEEDAGFPWQPVVNEFTELYMDDYGNIGKLPDYDFGMDPFVRAGHGLRRLIDSGAFPPEMSKRLWSRWTDISGGGL